jgi:hypothetical protein
VEVDDDDDEQLKKRARGKKALMILEDKLEEAGRCGICLELAEAMREQAEVGRETTEPMRETAKAMRELTGAIRSQNKQLVQITDGITHVA